MTRLGDCRSGSLLAGADEAAAPLEFFRSTWKLGPGSPGGAAHRPPAGMTRKQLAMSVIPAGENARSRFRKVGTQPLSQFNLNRKQLICARLARHLAVQFEPQFCLECFRKSGNRFSEKKHDETDRVLPEKWEPVFRKEARRNKQSASGKVGTGFPKRSTAKQTECFRKSGNRFSEKKHDETNRALPEKWEPVFRKEARRNKQSASGKVGTGFPKRSTTKQTERFRESGNQFSEKKHDETDRVLPEKWEPVFRKEARRNKQSASGKVGTGFPKRSTAKQTECFRKSGNRFSEKKPDDTKS